MRRPEKREVSTDRGPMTVIVARNRVHAFGSNGWDVLLWAGSWVGRLATRDRRWRVNIRAGAPRLWSGTQELVYAEVFDSREHAVRRAEEMAAAIRRGEWPADSPPMAVPGNEWLQPQSRREAVVRLFDVVTLGALAVAFALLGCRSPG